MEESIPSGRRWFQFGLRSLFVAVAIIAVVLSWELRIVRQRRALRASIQAGGGRLTSDACPNWMGRITTRPDLFPQWRRWLGDSHVDSIEFNRPSAPSDAEVAEARRLFPEARIYIAESPRGKEELLWSPP